MSFHEKGPRPSSKHENKEAPDERLKIISAENIELIRSYAVSQEAGSDSAARLFLEITGTESTDNLVEHLRQAAQT